MAQQAPIPSRVEKDVIAVPRLNVPRGDSWWDKRGLENRQKVCPSRV
jgi:hypothetical protein